MSNEWRLRILSYNLYVGIDNFTLLYIQIVWIILMNQSRLNKN